MKVVTAVEMRGIDRKTIEEYGIPGMVLMERAGLAVALKIRELFEKKKVIVLAGGGNNGGDGIAAARNLFNWGWNVKVLLLSREEALSTDCRAQYRTALQVGVPVEFRHVLTAGDLHSALVVDAMIGTGLNKPVRPPISELIRRLNNSEARVVSVDIPSGISSDNAQVMGEAVRADYTVTFGLPKVGHLLPPGNEYTGSLFVDDIGFPDELLNSEHLKAGTVEKSEARVLLPERPVHSHKGDYGHVLVVAGSRGKTGAALMTAKACLRAGAGMVTIGIPETLADAAHAHVLEEMVLPLPDTGRGILSEKSVSPIIDFLENKADVLAMGPGLTAAANISKLMKKLLAAVTVPMVLDADALNAISGNVTLFERVKSPVILTPHIGEMARLLVKKPLKEMTGNPQRELIGKLQKDTLNAVASFSKDTGAYLVLKGAPTILAEPEGRIFINTTGNPGMATAGSGDVLTGMIAALLGQGLHPRDAAVLGIYLHGLAGDLAASCKGLHSLIAGDIIDHVPAAFLSLGTE